MDKLATQLGLNLQELAQCVFMSGGVASYVATWWWCSV